MKYWLNIFLLFIVGALPARADIEVFACEPEWAALIGELAGEHAQVFSATSALQDVHHIQARPSLIAKLRRADLLICTGADLETGWLPVLLRRSGNPAVLPGSPGYFMASNYVEMRAVPAQLDRAHGDVHPQGNPHIHLNPNNLLPIAEALRARLSELDPEQAETYRRRTGEFTQRWKSALKTWRERAQPLIGMPVVVYHNGWLYMNDWLDLEQVAELEPKPGIPPSSRHLSVILQRMKETPARAIIRAPYQDKRAVDWLHEHTGIPVLELPYTIGGTPEADTLFSLFDITIDLLLGVNP